MKQNSFPMRDWHVKHMEQTLVRFVTGLSENATRWEKRLNKKYGRIGKVCKRLEYDIKHGVEKKQVYSFLQSIRTDPSFSDVRNREGSMIRLDEIQEYFKESPIYDLRQVKPYY
ncbi:MAG: hypothetical protein E6K94_08655 [Thaumarchaeota archaeon]|nr:MAG: hypothetical protein E6L03_03240 [Nitrososphaerota archaeon]TLX86379.1 MAG: hypothetical protein E6L01_04020 [Nitrososphaerota archaeon]TLX89939.1 MAG: hypothetical protein E6K94_08655 [Nitrososphaerota archaeon]